MPDRPAVPPTDEPAYKRLREELMRVGVLAVSDRIDGCINKTTALRIREIAYRACAGDAVHEIVYRPASANDERGAAS